MTSIRASTVSRERVERRQASDGRNPRARLATWTGQQLFRTGLGARLARDDIIVVAFHRVNNTTAGDALTCEPKMFDALCALFAEHFDVMSLDGVVDQLHSRTRRRKQALAITFDDGYLDNCRVAAPILAAYNLPATFFVTTDFMATERVAPWDARLPNPPPWMHWDDIGELQHQGFEIGCHTRSHPDLGKISGAQAEDEIFGARAILANRLGRAPRHFAFPFGRRRNISAENRERVMAAGFRSCSSCEGGVNPPGSDAFDLSRIPIANMHESAEHFALLAKLGRL